MQDEFCTFFIHLHMVLQSSGGSRTSRGGRSPTRALFGENVCENEKIGSCGWRAPDTPPRSANASTYLVFKDRIIHSFSFIPSILVLFDLNSSIAEGPIILCYGKTGIIDVFGIKTVPK